MKKYPTLLSYLSFLSRGLITAALLTVTAAYAGEQPLTGEAYQLADEAYKAFAQKKYDTAATKARRAIQLRPDVARLHDLLKKAEAARHPSPGNTASGVAQAAAGKAYKAYEKRDYAAAVEEAKRATSLVPGKRDYWLLLMNSLTADGQLEEAKRVGNEIERKFGRKNDLLAAQKAVNTQLAFRASAASYTALGRGDVKLALEQAHKAVDYLPTVAAFRIGLINVLVADGKLAEAEQIASDMIASEKPSGEALSLRAAIRQLRGETQSAQTDFDNALSATTSAPAMQRGIRLVAIDAALANGDKQRTQHLLEPLQSSTDPEVVKRRAQLSDMLSSRSDSNQAIVAFSFPLFSCSTGADLISVCDINPGSTSADPGFVLADQGYRAFAAKNYALASSKAAEAIQLSPRNHSYRRLYVQALVAQGMLAEAEQAASAALADFGNDTDILLTRADIRKRRGNSEGARADYAAILIAPDVTPRAEIVALAALGRKEEARKRLAVMISSPVKESDLDLAYLALQVEDDSDALVLFGQADTQGKLTDTARNDAAYAASRAGRNELAIRYFNQTVDAAEAGRLPLEPQQVFDIRRASADLSRRWGINAFVSQGSMATAGTGVPYGSSIQGTFAGAEAFWRPLGYQDGKLLEIYGRFSETVSGGTNVPSGTSTEQIALGARVKPFSDINAIVALERLVPLGSATTGDWLARVGFSSDSGLDLHVDKNNWFTGHLYAEAGHYFQHPENYAVLEGQSGRSFRLAATGPNLVLFPHVVLSGSYDSTIVDHTKQAWGSGPGLNIRYWFRQDHYNAPRSYADLSVQYRWRIAGDGRAEGWVIRLNTYF